jgi:hypothetical protein
MQIQLKKSSRDRNKLEKLSRWIVVVRDKKIEIEIDICIFKLYYKAY